MLTLRIVGYFCSVALSVSSLYAAPWTNTEGKSIEADFVRLEDKTVVLKAGDKVHKIPLDKLNVESQAFAAYMDQHMNEWALANATSTIISEEILIGLLNYKPKLVEGKNYLVEGIVTEVKQFGRTLDNEPDHKAEVTLQGGSKFPRDFGNEHESNGSTKVKIQNNQVELQKGRNWHKGVYSNFTFEKKLLGVGDQVFCKAIINEGKLDITGAASEQEITQAKMTIARQNGMSEEEVTKIELIRIRIELLEAQLKNSSTTATSVAAFTGEITTTTVERSDAEKDAIKKEIELLKAQRDAQLKR